MDSNIDPESEALIRKLHRELNGLTRSTRGSDRVKPSSSYRTGPAKAEPPQRTSSEPLPSNIPAKRKAGLSRMESGSEASSSGSEEKEGRPAKKHRKPDAGPEPRSHKAKPQSNSPLETTSKDKKEVLPPADAIKKEKAHVVVKVEHGAAADVGHAHAAHAASAHRDPEAPTSSNPEAAPTFKSPLEAAAAAASALVKEKVKAAASRGRASEGKRLIKCFHAGVRWGIALAPEALKTRADLATALNDAFAGEILSCGRGDILNIVFLDGEGRLTEFPSIRNSGSRDRSTKWKVAVDHAVKIYVRRG